ncbi:titin-like isoform X2 [Melitaea cinxia]|uniref:titin-like isoform X2 n=1 Tax=Melitaea cinxia TaxID=113334 RepID=UPI001E27139E|nr:titin-like isoform X2 [Melitaea cinxia]
MKSKKDDLSNDIETLLEEVKIVQANLSDLPDESLDAMEEGLREGITILVKCEEAAILLEQKIMEYRQEVEVQALLKELLVIKARIAKLLLQARQGLTTIQNAKVELARQTEETEEQKNKIAKLDHWLADINNELKESTKQSDVLTEDDIIRYIEVYERYIREYEEYETIIKSIVVINRDDSSQMKQNLNKTIKTLEETRNLVILEIERLRQMLIQIRTAPEVVDDDISQTDRTIDSTSMPEEIVSPREPAHIEEPEVKEPLIEKIETDVISKVESEPSKLETKIEEPKEREEKQVKPNVTIETQTGKSLLSEPPSLVDKSVICKTEDKVMQDVSVTCAPPQEVTIQTSEAKSSNNEILENIEVIQTISDGHETIEVASRPVRRDQKIDEKSLFVDAQYKDDNLQKDSKLNITHSLPQSFETVMVEPDETTTEVVVDADGTKRIIVKKVRKTLVTRQQIVQPQYSTGEDIPQDQSFSRLVLTEDAGYKTRLLEDGGTRYIQYQTSDGQVITGVPDSEVTIQEFTSRPDMVIKMEKGMKPEEILQLAEGEIPSHIQTSSSSVTAVVQQVTKRIVKTKRRIIRRVTIVDGKEHLTEEVVEEPDDVEVFEEQIPRVSINVKDGKTTVGDSNNQDNPPFPLSAGPGDKRDDDIDKNSKKDHENKFEDIKPSPKEQQVDKTLKDEKQPTELNDQKISDLRTLTKEFLDKESAQIGRAVVTESMYPSESEIILHPTSQVETDKSMEGGISFITGNIHSTVQSNRSKIATLVKKVTKKVIRIKKRIIKHIQIIDGKEHVTEEVIEEPEEVEITEDEPQISQFVENEGETQTKRIRIIRQVHVIDGKEHVTEQIVEDPDDQEESSSKSVYLPTHQLNITEVLDPEIPDDSKEEPTLSPQDKSIKELTKDLIEREISNLETRKPHETEQLTTEDSKIVEDPVRDSENLTQTHTRTILTKTRKRIIKHKQIIDGKEHVTEEVIEEPDDVQVFENEPNFAQFIQKQDNTQTKHFKVIRQVHIIDGKEHVTEQIVEDPDNSDKIMSETVPSSKLDITEIIGQATSAPSDDAYNIVTKDDKKSKDLALKEIDHTKITPAPKKIPEKETKMEQEHGVAVPEIKEIDKIDRDKYNETHMRTILTRTRKRIIKHIKVIDGKEHVTEEVIEEPDDIEVIETRPLSSHVIQREGTKTKRIKIIRQIQTIDGKEHITEKIVEDPDDEYVADSTVTATVDVQMDKPDLTSHKEKEILVSSIPGDKTTIPFKIDINKDLIKSEIAGSDILPIPIKNIDKVLKPEELVFDNTTANVSPSQPSEKPNKKDDTKQIITIAKTVIETVDPDDTITEKVINDQFDFTSEEKVPNLKIEKEKEPHPGDISRMLIESESNHSTVLISSPNNVVVEVLQKSDLQVPMDLRKEDADNKQTIISEKEDIKYIEKQNEPVIEKPSQVADKTVPVKTQDVLIPKSSTFTPENKITVEDVKKEKQQLPSTPDDQEQHVEKNILDSTVITETDLHINKLDMEKPKDKSKEIVDYTKVDINMSFIKGEVDQTKVKPSSSELLNENVTEVYKQLSPNNVNVQSELKPEEASFRLPDNEIIEKLASEAKLGSDTINKGDEKVVDQSNPKDRSLIDTTCRLIESETEHSYILSEKSKAKVLSPFESTETIDFQDNKQKVISEDDAMDNHKLIEVKKDKHIIVSTADSVKTVSKEPMEVSLPRETVDIENVTQNISKTITRRRIIKHVQIIDGKEHVTEEVIEEPDVVEAIEATPNPNINIQEEGIKTKRIKIIRQMHIVDGKEHVTEQIIEDSDDEYIPDSTITADINLNLTESDLSKVKPEKHISEGLKIEEIVEGEPKETIKTENTDDSHLILTSQLTENVKGETPMIEIMHNVPKIAVKKEMKMSQQPELSNYLDKEILAISTQLDILDVAPENSPQSIKDISEEFLTRETTKLSDIPKSVDDSSRDKEEKKLVRGLVVTPEITDANDAIDIVISKDTQLTDEKVNASPSAESRVESTMKPLHPPIQSSIQVEPVETDTVVSEMDVNFESKKPEISYIQQFEPVTQDSPEIIEKDLTIQFIASEVKPTETKDSVDIVAAPVRLDSKHDITTFIESERIDTDSRIIQDSLKLSNKEISEAIPEKLLEIEEFENNLEKPVNVIKPSQTVDMLMSLSKLDKNREYEPKIEVDIKLEKFETQKPSITKREIRTELPSEIVIVDKHPKKEVCGKVKKEVTDKQSVCEESVTYDPKVEHPSEDKESHESADLVHTETSIETDKSIDDTESSSLGHYVQLETAASHESPKPTENVLETVVTSKDISDEPLSASTEFEQITERGYEPEDTSINKEPVAEKRKKHKKQKSHIISEETVYPKQTTTEDDTAVSTPVEMKEPIHQKKTKTKKGKKKTPVTDKSPENISVTTPDTKCESPKVGHEIVTSSPQEESCHTISETSEANTIKIVEECIGSSPEVVTKEVTTTVTYPVPIVEEIPTSEYSVQTSPDVVETEKDKVETPKTEVISTELQTSPTPVKEILTQTTPIKEVEAETQTLDTIKITEKVDSLDSQVQTSRTESPEKIITSEVTTQVVLRDLQTPDDKFSQTSSPIEEVEKGKDCRDMQTSPLPQVQKNEKSTEIVIETAESNIQTVKQDVIDQETSTSPVKVKELTEMSIQTPEVPVVDTYTQSELSIVDMKTYKAQSPSLPESDVTNIVETIDNSQQTSPRTEYVEIKPEIDESKKEIIMIDSTQQTSPRVEKDITSPKSSLEFIKNEIITIDSTQQTTPRDYTQIERPKALETYADKNNIVTIDSTQQTTPRGYSEDSISTSTDEPYEVHLHAQISIPRTDDFIENERQAGQISQHIPKESNRQKKRKAKKKVESPLLSPSSLSDPINAELSYSITPTSDDLSSKEASSIDEGISQIASPVYPNQQELYNLPTKPTYSDVVQRSKSKSPSPSKTVFTPKVGKTRLINTLEKRTQYLCEPRKMPDDTLSVALIEPSVEKSYDLVVNKELKEVSNAIKNNDPDKVEKSILVVIETISIWLEEIQYKIQRQAIEGNKPSNESERVKSLENYVQNLKEIIYVTEVNEEIVTLIETLTRQIHTVSYLRNRTTEKVKEEEREWDKFLSDIDRLSSSVEELKITLDKLIISEKPSQEKLDNLDEIEKDNVNNLDFTKQLFQKYRSFIEINPKRECPPKLFILDEDTKQIENTINTERDRLLQLTSLAEEYEQTLQDFGQITDVAEALLDGKIIVSNLDHLHEEIQKHRKFFVNLSHCRAILESLENNLDTETRTKHSALHHSLHDRATIIIDRAAGRAQQMTLAASRWSVLDQSMKEEQQWLRVAQQRIPDLSNVTSIDHEQYINLYQSISLDASQHYAKMIRLLSITEGLQGLIVCSGLETECSVALDMLIKLQEDVDSRLTRLTAFRENWLTYDHLIDRIEGWMKLANKELEHITPENITTTSNLRRFWELKAQHEVHNNLKNELGVQFEKALEILPISDEMVQRQFFSKIEDKWRDLSSRIHHIHSSAIKNISDRDVPSSEKLNILEDEMRELRAMLDALKGVIKSEDELNLYIERLQVMTSRIDRIQNELGRLSLLPTAESERLGALLTQSGILDDQIAEELERSMLLKEKIVQVQAGIGRCQKSQRRARLTLEECEAAERLGSDVVERASQTCEKLIEDLSTQWRDILALRQALHTLPTALRVCVSPIGVERDISALQDSHAELEAACNELSVRLRSKLQLWRRFERQLELVQGAVREADYMVELLTVQGQVDYDRLLKATEKLETLSDSLSRRSGELVGSLRDAAAPLESSTEPTIAAKLRKELDDAAAAYDHTCTNLTQLCDKYHKAVDLWRRYREAAAGVRAFAEQHEGALHALKPHDAPAAHQVSVLYIKHITIIRISDYNMK